VKTPEEPLDKRPPQSSTYSITAIDGYLRNAGVWLALNRNSTKDPDENIFKRRVKYGLYKVSSGKRLNAGDNGCLNFIKKNSEMISELV
jgi:hypothetical protein